MERVTWSYRDLADIQIKRLLHNKYVSILYNYGSAKDFQDGRAETKKLWYTCEFAPSFFFSIYNQDNKKKQKSKMMATFSTFVLVCVIDKKSYNVTRFRKNDNNSVYFPLFSDILGVHQIICY